MYREQKKQERKIAFEAPLDPLVVEHIITTQNMFCRFDQPILCLILYCPEISDVRVLAAILRHRIRVPSMVCTQNIMLTVSVVFRFGVFYVRTVHQTQVHARTFKRRMLPVFSRLFICFYLYLKTEM